MNWHVLTVPKCDVGLALGAINLGGGTVTATNFVGDDVSITYTVANTTEPFARRT